MHCYVKIFWPIQTGVCVCVLYRCENLSNLVAEPKTGEKKNRVERKCGAETLNEIDSIAFAVDTALLVCEIDVKL